MSATPLLLIPAGFYQVKRCPLCLCKFEYSWGGLGIVLYFFKSDLFVFRLN